MRNYATEDAKHFWDLIVAAAIMSGRRMAAEAVQIADAALVERNQRYPPEEEPDANRP